MIWLPILREWSVTEDSSLGGGGAASAALSPAFVSFSCAPDGIAVNSVKAAAAHKKPRHVFRFIPQVLLGTSLDRLLIPRILAHFGLPLATGIVRNLQQEPGCGAHGVDA